MRSNYRIWYLHINLAWTHQFSAKLLNRNFYRLSRVSIVSISSNFLFTDPPVWRTDRHTDRQTELRWLRRATAVAAVARKMVEDRHRLAAYHDKHWWPWTTLNPKNKPRGFGKLFAILDCGAHFKIELCRNGCRWTKTTCVQDFRH